MLDSCDVTVHGLLPTTDDPSHLPVYTERVWKNCSLLGTSVQSRGFTDVAGFTSVGEASGVKEVPPPVTIAANMDIQSAFFTFAS